ncbi:MAG: hypothetical protein MMC23_008515 [Stictis urceolatum]|nr:hypothetical protein [Stictis urceolata]
MAAAGAAAWALLYYISWPFVWIVQLVWTILSTVVAPLVILVRYVLHGLVWPFQFLARFETLYIYFGVALLVGVLVGACIHYLASLVISVLGIDKASELGSRRMKPHIVEGSPKEFSRRKARLDASTGLNARLARVPLPERSDWLQLDKSSLKSPSLLMSSTILEEDDSSDSGMGYV